MESWPEEDQEELAEFAREIEATVPGSATLSRRNSPRSMKRPGRWHAEKQQAKKKLRLPSPRPPHMNLTLAPRAAADVGQIGATLERTAMNDVQKAVLSKVPAVTLGFWVIKILATTLGETGGDTVTMTLKWGYLAGTALFAAVLILFVIAQIVAKRFHPSSLRPCLQRSSSA